jgi:N-acetylmuramoyl-L-alanine amidase
MIKVIVLFQTKLILILSTALLGFNVSLATTVLEPGKVIQSERNAAPNPGIYSWVNPLDNAYQIKTVVIDAGHGGHDPGCHGASAHEKHITLAIAKKLGELLRSRFPEIRVILTRDHDVFIPLYERAEIANRNSADLFISIHCNAMPGNNSGTYGTETYVMGLHTAQYNLEVAKRENAAILLEDNYQKNYDYDPNSPEGHIMISMFQNAYLKQSLQFAELVENNLNTQAKRKTRGVKQAGFVVLKATAMPSVLVETGFLSNASEEQFLNGNYGQEQVAGAMLEAFAQYKSSAEVPDFRSEGQYDTEPGKAIVASSNDKPVTYSYGATASTKRVENPTNTQIGEMAKSKEIPAPERGNAPGSNEPNPARYGPVPPSANAPRYNYGTQVAAPQTNVPLPKANERSYAFKIQLAAGPIAPNPAELKWKTFPYPLEVSQEDNLYKVRTAAFSDYQQANLARNRSKELGFADAFIIALKDGKRISLPDAKKALGIP